MKSKPTNKIFSDDKKGAILILVVVITGIFVIILYGFLSLITYQQKLTRTKVAKIQALHVAEAGVNYYRWHLAHDPEDFTDGILNGTGPFVHDYYDPTTGLIGTYSLEITPPQIGSTIVGIKSTGWINEYPNITKIIDVKYGKPSLARFSILTNSDIWLGDTESVSGEFHSNGGIRMDGANNSLVTSALEEYTCTPSHGCNYETRDGVWGNGPNDDLWAYPVPEIDFETITLDLASIKNEAVASGHYYDGQNYGYHLTFLADGTYNLYTITSLESGLNQIDDNFTGCETKSERINNETFIGNYPVPNNSTIFIEDDLWIDGVLNGKVTVAAGRFPVLESTNANIYINNNLQYLARDNNHALGLVAQKNIQIPRHAPTNLIIDAMMLAQYGRTYRAYYCSSGLRLVKNSIEVYGGIITNKIWTWSWVNGSGTTIDGYQNTTSIFDNNLLYNPPPYFPTRGDYEFISWEELPN